MLLGVMVIILGIVIGSFLNVVIYRVPEGESLIHPGSHCPHCNEPLRGKDLVPLVSYLLQGGRCRYCKERVSVRYPLVEGLTGLVFYLGYLLLGPDWVTLTGYFGYASLAIAIAFIDYDHQIIPDGLVVFGLLWSTGIRGAGTLIEGSPFITLDALWGLLAGGGMFLLIAILSKGGMGGGDVKYMALVGYATGLTSVVLVMFLSFVIGAALSIVLLVSRIKGRKEAIPFGPFISIGWLLTLLFQEPMIQWYFLNLGIG
ncbi:MAG: hypothetical protein AVO33_01970 [delta proteobacterium ML8_F1]|nr:MAG: hypothetical protein AVO33_01970 [delta proteobacterium ML8_F1]